MSWLNVTQNSSVKPHGVIRMVDNVIQLTIRISIFRQTTDDEKCKAYRDHTDIDDDLAIFQGAGVWSLVLLLPSETWRLFNADKSLLYSRPGL